MEEDMIMHRAIRNGDEAAVIRLLEADPALLERWDGFGHRPLTLAASIRGIWAARLLIQKGANINGSTCDGGTALHQAARRDDEQMAILLLRHGAQANSTDDNHMTPLMLACRRNSVGVVKLLLQHTEGQGLEQRDRDGCTALFHAAKLARLEVIALLLNEGAHANAANRIGRTPLMAASTSTPLGVVHGTVGRQAVQMLSEQMKGQGLDERDCEGLTALHLAAGHGNMAAVRGLLLAGADPTITDRSGRSPHAFAQKVMDDGEYYEHAAKWQLTSCMAMLQEWEAELERPAILYRARSLHKAHTTQRDMPTSQVPTYLEARVAAGHAVPRVEVVSPQSEGQHEYTEQQEQGGASGKRKADEARSRSEAREERRHAVAEYVVKALNEELFIELLEGFHWGK